MRALKTKTISAGLFVLVLGLLNTAATCQKHMVQNTRACAVAGVLAAGMDCANTLSDETDSMNLDQTIEFLEPQLSRKDPKTGKKLPERAGALCLSADDYVKTKNDLETLCRLLGSRCTYEVKERLQKADERLTGVLNKGLEKRKERNPKR